MTWADKLPLQIANLSDKRRWADKQNPTFF